MKVHLMHPDRAFDLTAELPGNAEDLRQDLGVDAVVAAAAQSDDILARVFEHAVLAPMLDVEQILFRQNVLADFLDNRHLLRDMYAVTAEAIEAERKGRFFWMMTATHPEPQLKRGIGILEVLLGPLRQLRQMAETSAPGVRSEGLAGLLATLTRELSEEYLQTVTAELAALQLRGGVAADAALGPGNTIVGYRLRRPPQVHRWWSGRVTIPGRAAAFELPPRDETGAAILTEMRERALADVARAVDESASHVLTFLTVLRTELGFYLGCLNLHEELARRGVELCFPTVAPEGDDGLAFRGLRDASLALRAAGPVLGNDLDPGDHRLVVVTGANSGGKSTFLRSLGLAQLLAQCGTTVPAQQMALDARPAVFTHFRREEDATMTRGKLDEELARMSRIVDTMPARSLMLLNESFASTYEAEGSEIARNIVRALLTCEVRVVLVTHMYDLASSLTGTPDRSVTSLRAERTEDGTRTYRIVPGEPTPTSYGTDLYRRVFRDMLGEE